jgi:hypothetical protein
LGFVMSCLRPGGWHTTAPADEADAGAAPASA